MSNVKRQMSNVRIGIIGLGYVGSPIRDWFKAQGHEVFVYDKFKKEGSVKEVNKADIIFIAVPTPFHEDGRGYDDSAVRDALRNVENGKVAVIKSTVLPGSTSEYQKEYPEKTIFFNPEFLRAKYAKEDYLHPKLQILGYANEKGKEIALKILELLPNGEHSEIIRATEAEVLKYWLNSYLATRVIFANEIYDLCEALEDVSYEEIKNVFTKDRRVGDSHWDVLADDYRGYGGACFPKDVQALLQKAGELGVELGLIRQGWEKNKKLRDI